MSVRAKAFSGPLNQAESSHVLPKPETGSARASGIRVCLAGCQIPAGRSEAGAKSAEITVAGLLDELEHARRRADSLGQLSASVRAISEKARLAGLVVDRQQVEVVNADPYADAESIDEVMAKMIEDFGFEPAEAVAKAFGLQICEDGEILDIKRSTPRSVGNIRNIVGKTGNAGAACNTRRVLEWTPPKKSTRASLPRLTSLPYRR